ncbi:MAG: hypothetical protein PWQ87_127 [Candidatus Woesearchaeota archaeon]|nr:hypothetical protein [Candidatus Woesearchaeota archaeon]
MFFFLVGLLFLIPLTSFSSYAIHPPLPMELYGDAFLFNEPAQVGTKITALDADGNICGTFEIVNEGHYGVLTCKGAMLLNDNTGPSSGEKIRFKIGTYPASASINNLTVDVIWSEGAFQRVDLTAPPAVCGDGFCDIRVENCNNCPEDCGPCQFVPGEAEGLEKVPSGGERPEGSLEGSSTKGGELEGPTFVKEEEEECVENWICSDWGPCLPEGIRKRECIDLNECGTNKSKPPEIEDCVYQPPVNETEEGNKTVVEEEPRRIFSRSSIDFCELRMDIFSLPSILFFVILFTFIASFVLFNKRKIRKLFLEIRNQEEGEELEKLREIASLKRKNRLFLLNAFGIAFVTYLYFYFFISCPDRFFGYIWYLLLSVMLFPILMTFFIWLFGYNEQRKKQNIRGLSSTHEKAIENMIRIVDHHLMKTEKEIMETIKELEEKPEFAELMRTTPALMDIYTKLQKLYVLYKSEMTQKSLEKELLDDINQLEYNKDVQISAEKYPELSKLLSNLKVISQAYNSKLDLYEELEEAKKESENEINMSIDDSKSLKNKKKQTKT